MKIKEDDGIKIFSDKNHAYTSYFNRLCFDPEAEKEKDRTKKCSLSKSRRHKF